VRKAIFKQMESWKFREKFGISAASITAIIVPRKSKMSRKIKKLILRQQTIT